jgi:hypothetical protein
MKTQKEIVALLSKQVKEVNLAKDKMMSAGKAVGNIDNAITNLQGSAKLREDSKLNSIIKKLEAVNKELVSHLNANYQW